MTTVSTQPRDSAKRERIATIGGALAIITAAVIGMLLFVRGDDSNGSVTGLQEGVAVPAPMATPGASGSTAERPALWIVESEEAANMLYRQLAEADAIRGGLGQRPMEARVVVSGEAAQALAALADENFLREARGLPTVQVFDLRKPAPSEPPAADPLDGTPLSPHVAPGIWEQSQQPGIEGP